MLDQSVNRLEAAATKAAAAEAEEAAAAEAATVLKMNRVRERRVQSRPTAGAARNKHRPPLPLNPSCQCDQGRRISRSLGF